MTETITYTQLRPTARVSGAIYLLLFVSGIFAEFFVRSSLIVPGDAMETAARILASPMLFRSGIVMDLVMIIADIALAVLFFELLKPVNRMLAALAAAFRFAQAAVLAFNLLNLYFVLELLSGTGYLAALGAGQLEALSLFFATMHGTGYALGLVFFGVSLAMVGYLTWKADYLPTILGILLMVAAVGYLADSFARTLLIEYDRYAPIFDTAVFMPAFVAELAMSLYLLIRGVRRS